MFSPSSHEETHSIQHEVMVEEAIDKDVINKMSFVFVLSRGCPIRHLTWLEANNSSKVTLEPEHEDRMEEGIKDASMVEQGQSNFIDLIWSSSMCDLFEEAREFVHIFQRVVHQAMIQLCVLLLVVAAYDHARNCKLLKKGNHFGEIVNGFI